MSITSFPISTKQVTGLALREDFDATCNFAVDDAIQTKRCTGAQIKNFISGGLTIQAGDYTVTINDGIVLFNDVSADRTCDFPAANVLDGKIIRVGNISGHNGKVVIPVINDFELDCKGSWAEIVSDGSEYILLNSYFPSLDIDLTEHDLALYYFDATWKSISAPTIPHAIATIYKLANNWRVKLDIALSWATPSSDELLVSFEAGSTGLSLRERSYHHALSEKSATTSYITNDTGLDATVQLYCKRALSSLGIRLTTDYLLNSRPTILNS